MGPACFYAAGHNTFSLFIDLPGIYFRTNRGTSSQSKKIQIIKNQILSIALMLSAFLYFFEPLWADSPVILGSDWDTLDMRRRKEAGDYPTLTGMP